MEIVTTLNRTLVVYRPAQALYRIQCFAEIARHVTSQIPVTLKVKCRFFLFVFFISTHRRSKIKKKLFTNNGTPSIIIRQHAFVSNHEGLRYKTLTSHFREDDTSVNLLHPHIPSTIHLNLFIVF